MKMKPVNSSNIESIGYDKDLKTLFINFINSGIYEYASVSKNVYVSFMNASSKGKYFYNNIRGKYAFKKKLVF